VLLTYALPLLTSIGNRTSPTDNHYLEAISSTQIKYGNSYPEVRRTVKGGALCRNQVNHIIASAKDSDHIWNNV